MGADGFYVFILLFDVYLDAVIEVVLCGYCMLVCS